MRAIPSALANHLASGATTTCRCWRVLRPDGVVLGFTDHDEDLTIGATLCAAQSGLDAAEAEQALGFAVAGTEVSGALQADSLNETDLANGLFDGATVETWLVNWASPADRLLLDVAIVGEVRRSDIAFTAELRGLAALLDQDRGLVFQASCSADLGDNRCRVALATPAYSRAATIVSTDGRFELTADLGDYAGGWFTGGLITFSSGANAGAAFTVKSHSVDAGQHRLSLWTRPAQALAGGDAFTVQAGCDKRLATCRDKFANTLNHRGFPHMPGNDVVMSYAAAGDVAMDGGSLFR